MPELSVVIPAYNEASRIGPTLVAFDRYFRERALDAEIIVVDDGSVDGTSEMVKKPEFSSLRVVINDRNRGKGFSVRRGLSEACGGLRLLADADGSTPVNEIAKFIRHLDEGADIVIASRAKKDSVLPVRQSFVRRFMGFVFRNMVRLMFLFPYADTQCGFKMFTAGAVQKILPHCQEDGFVFDVEMLYWARRMGLNVHEVGVTWSDCAGSKVTIMKGPVIMFLRLLRLRMRTIMDHFRR